MFLRSFFSTIILIAYSIWSNAQSSDALNLIKNPNYSEENIFKVGSDYKFIQQIFYDGPAIDDEHCFILELMIKDFKKFHDSTTLDLIKDSSFVKCIFDIHSVWNWEEEKTKIEGTVKVLNTTKKKITLLLNIEIFDLCTKRTFNYSGIRNFVRSNSKWKKSYARD